jgi:hypothetical protein
LLFACVAGLVGPVVVVAGTGDALGVTLEVTTAPAVIVVLSVGNGCAVFAVILVLVAATAGSSFMPATDVVAVVAVVRARACVSVGMGSLAV